MANKITIGSDPEFIIVSKDNEMVSAIDFLGNCGKCNPCSKCGKTKCTGNRRLCGVCNDCEDECDYCCACEECETGCREENARDCGYCDDCDYIEDLFESEIGCDGCEDVGELRPKYENNPIDHHNNILGLIENIELPEGYYILAGTVQHGYALGGHIHIGGYSLYSTGVKKSFKNTVMGYSDRNNRWFTDMNNLSKYLSYYCGIPLRKIEYKNELKIRGLNPSVYGWYGVHNSKEEYGIEWRMPASWLVSSEIALSALSLAHVVASEFSINPEDKSLSESAYITLVNRDSIDSIINKIEGMKYYSKYSKEIEPLFQMINENKKWKKDVNIKEQW